MRYPCYGVHVARNWENGSSQFTQRPICNFLLQAVASCSAIVRSAIRGRLIEHQDLQDAFPKLPLNVMLKAISFAASVMVRRCSVCRERGGRRVARDCESRSWCWVLAAVGERGSRHDRHEDHFGGCHPPHLVNCSFNRSFHWSRPAPLCSRATACREARRLMVCAVVRRAARRGWHTTQRAMCAAAGWRAGGRTEDPCARSVPRAQFGFRSSQ